MVFKSEKKDVKLIGSYEKFFFMSRHLIWVAIFKDDIALKSCKMFDTTEVKKEKKMAFISYLYQKIRNSLV